MAKAKQKKVDKALDMTFPASDPPASGKVTGTEPPARPSGRQAPIISKDDLEAAAGGEARRQDPVGERKRHHGVGHEGLRRGDDVDESDEQQGLGRDGSD